MKKQNKGNELKTKTICFRCKKSINKKEEFSSDIETPNRVSYYHRGCFNKVAGRVNKPINLNALGGYHFEKSFCKFLDRLIKKGCPSIKELKEIRKESGFYLANLKLERDEALKFLKKK